MGRPRDVRERLQQAALELYGERGYDQTTTSEIAERAGVTERTFFRHFADKREVLFDGESIVILALTTAIHEAPAALGPLELLRTAFRSVEAMVEANRAFAEPRHRVIASTPALQERELAKMATLSAALATALQARGLGHNLSVLAAQAGVAAFVQAALSWFEDPQPGFGNHLDRSFGDLRQLAAEPVRHS